MMILGLVSVIMFIAICGCIGADVNADDFHDDEFRTLFEREMYEYEQTSFINLTKNGIVAIKRFVKKIIKRG